MDSSIDSSKHAGSQYFPGVTFTPNSDVLFNLSCLAPPSDRPTTQLFIYFCTLLFSMDPLRYYLLYLAL